jgi:hypothetical protein
MAKAPLDVRSLARQHTAAAIASLAGIATNGKSESARVAACDVLLQRGWGKPQASEGGDGAGVRITIRKILEGGVTVVEQRPSDREMLAIEARPQDEPRRD